MPLIKFLSHSYAKFLFKTWVCLLVLFFALRCFFYFVNHDANLESSLYGDAFFMGFRFDTVIICYSLFIPFALLGLASFIRSNTFLLNLAFILICIELIPIELITCANIPYFKQFGAVISKSAFIWQASPAMMSGLIFSNFSYWGYLILFAFFYFISIYLIKGYFIQLKTDLVEFPQPNILFKLVIFLGIACILVLGARGTASQKTAIHQGFATISDDQFINSLGLNPCFVFFQSYLNEKENSAYIIPKNIDSYLFNVKKYLGVSNSDPLSINRNAVAVDPPTKKNLVIVLMESMCMYKLGYLKGNNISPNFSSIIKESIFFDRFYSSGTHTFAGLFATETGFPSIYTQHGLVNYTRKPFNSIGTILKENNFTNYFFTTHDPRFDNMEGFFKLNGYANIVGESEFSISESIGTLGVPDHVLLDKVIEKINSDKTEKPFHAFVLTSSDHGPWIVPDNISFKPNSENEQERAAQYADWAIGEFMKKAKKQSWYNNTIFVFLGDHGVYTATSYQMPLSFHHIPFVIHAANLKPDTNSNLGYQPDVLATVMGLLNINYENTGFGIDLLKEKHPYVFFNADVEYGIMNADGYYYFHMLPTDEKHIRNGLKFEERDYFDEKKAYADSMEFNARSIMESADFLIHKSYYNK